MSEGLKIVIYPVTDIAKAKALFGALLGAEPVVDQPYYVQFQAGEQTIGLDPNGHRDGMTAYWQVDNIGGATSRLVAAGAEVLQPAKNVGGGRQTATLKDADGNLIGLVQDPE